MARLNKPVIRTVCRISTVAKHPRGGKSMSQLRAENAQLRARLRPHGWAAR